MLKSGVHVLYSTALDSVWLPALNTVGEGEQEGGINTPRPQPSSPGTHGKHSS